LFHNLWSSNASSMNFTSLGCAAVYQRTLRQYDGLSAKTLRQLDGLSAKTRLLSGWINIVGYKSTDSPQKMTDSPSND